MRATAITTLLSRLCAAALLAGILSGCQNTPSNGPQPALLVTPDDTVRAQLKGIVSDALQTEVTLSQQALTTEPVLIIDAASRPRSLDASGAQGIWRDRPDHFELYLVNGQCRIKHRQSEREWPLPAATCEPVNGER
ncbi:hypothetical protein [Gilvimarinus agarilyticus]|uniref:hypothetical protein n=1 Tax=Gilvimarinus agarilyticus TaxID=679259 RepID=UPI0005A0CD69|nr:hypothetical protein [Gilvimarinus agarilyticus]